VSESYLAFDLGAESGRAVLGRLQSGALNIREIRRFPNEPVRQNGSLYWDVLRLWHEMGRALERAADARPASVGVDGWGVDYALIGERGNLLENPYHYRDVRSAGMMDAVFERVRREKIYDVTGIQFLQINTLFQLYAACLRTPEVVDAAQALLTIPDLLNYWLSGRLCSEYTVATTTQFIDARSRTWAKRLLSEIGLPTRVLTEIVQPGTVIGNIRRDAAPALAGTPVVAPACHDTGSAVASVSAGGSTAFISSGTWSLLGTEIDAPVITANARDLNFTNEGGVCGTIRLLKNIGGLWLLQACRRSWAADGHSLDYDALHAAAADDRLSFLSLIDPDDHAFLNPADMPAQIAQYCRQTSQPEPSGPAAYVRAILESLALKYRVVLESLEELTGRRFDQIRIVGGGSRNRLLNQFTADATGRTVLVGPVEATALGNIGMQMLAVGAVSSLAEARAVIDRSFPVERFEPSQTDRWDAQFRRFQQYLARPGAGNDRDRAETPVQGVRQ
jgi:rhamnulokinase